MTDARQPTADPLDPRTYAHILGKTFSEHDHRPVIKLGERTWTRWQLGCLGCPHAAAAANVQRIIETLGIRTTKEFLKRAGEFGTFQGVGVTAYWVVMALVADLGQDVEATHGHQQTFATVHRKALQQQERRRGRRKTKNRRRHETRGVATVGRTRSPRAGAGTGEAAVQPVP